MWKRILFKCSFTMVLTVLFFLDIKFQVPFRENNRMYLKEIGINTRNWVDLAEDKDYWKALVNAALNLRFHKPRS